MVYKNTKFCEENRSCVFSQSLHLPTQGILDTFSILNELVNKSKLVEQVLLAAFCVLLSFFLLFLVDLFSFFRIDRF
jgi:hypothetical protein